MKILWLSAAPWVRSGYGVQTALWCPRIAAMGHDVSISATYGIWGTTTEWDGIPVLPGGTHKYGADIILPRMKRTGSDILITLMDAWLLDAEKTSKIRSASWMPVDCNPLSAMDQEYLERSGATPIAMSEHGFRMLQHSGYEPLYVPHAIDPDVFRPAPDREESRQAMGIDDLFVIGLNTVNVDSIRKGVPEQLMAFSRLHASHPDTVLLIHGQVFESSEPNGLNIAKVVNQLGISNAVRYVDQYEHLVGNIGQDYLAEWYSVLDLLTSCSYAEGFGLPILEALACETPVVVTDAASMTQVGGPAAWRVSGERFWNPRHKAWWVKPSIDEIHAAYEEAYAKGQEYKDRKKYTREWALEFSVDKVQSLYWAPALKALEESL